MRDLVRNFDNIDNNDNINNNDSLMQLCNSNVYARNCMAQQFDNALLCLVSIISFVIFSLVYYGL